MISGFAYIRAKSLEEAIQNLTTPGAHLHAGGTDLLGCLRDGVFQAARVVSIGGLTKLRGVQSKPDGGLRIGALTTLSEIAAHAGIRKSYAALAEAAESAASPQLRNQGTIGGNLCQRPRCWYFRGDFQCARKGGDRCFAVEGENQRHCIFGGDICFMVHPSDTAPALVALDAIVRIAGPKGERSVAAEKFFVPPTKDATRENVLEGGEIITELVLPPPPVGGRGGYHKVRARGAWDFALVGVASSLSVESGVVKAARLVLSGVAPVPWRVPAAEKELLGKKLDAAAVRRCAETSIRNAEPMSGNKYKVLLTRGAVEDALGRLV